MGRQFGRLTKLYFGALTKRLEKLDIDRHFSPLILVSQTPRCTQQYLCDTLKIDKASMVRIIDYLSDKKYLKRVTNPSDRREFFLELTEKGKRNLASIQRSIDELNSLAIKGIAKKDLEIFHDCLCKVCRNLGSEPADEISLNFKKIKQKK
jgi:DNA-binding MarR family transcriptional regulator